MIKNIFNKTRNVAAKVGMIGTGLAVTASVAMADGTDPLAAALPTFKSALAVGGTIYYVVFGLGLFGAIIKGKQTGDWGKWLGGWAVCLIGYTGAMLLIGS